MSAFKRACASAADIWYDWSSIWKWYINDTTIFGKVLGIFYVFAAMLCLCFISALAFILEICIKDKA